MMTRTRRSLRVNLVARCCGLAALAAAGLAAPAGAQTPAPPTKEQMEHAVFDLRVVMSALQSDKLETPVKDALLGCLYGNSLAKISDTVDKVVVDNPGKIDRKDPTQILGVIASVCGYKPPAAAAK